jgi:hypothetical protein
VSLKASGTVYPDAPGTPTAKAAHAAPTRRLTGHRNPRTFRMFCLPNQSHHVLWHYGLSVPRASSTPAAPPAGAGWRKFITARRNDAHVRNAGLGDKSGVVNPPNGTDCAAVSCFAGMSTRSCQQTAST